MGDVYTHLCPQLPNNRFKELNVFLCSILFILTTSSRLQRHLKKVYTMTTKQRRPTGDKRKCLECGSNLSHRRTNVVFCNASCQNAEWRRVNPEKHRASVFNWYHNTKAKKQLNINNNQDQTNRKAS
jgi:hypothetical protein